MRHRATYRSDGGISCFFAAYDVHTDRLWRQQQHSRPAAVVLRFLPAMRRRHAPGQRPYLVTDNPSTHKTATILQWCRKKRVTPVFTATKASWTNRVECHQTAAHHFAIECSGFPDHAEANHPMQRYVRWRNRRRRDPRLFKKRNPQLALQRSTGFWG